MTTRAKTRSDPAKAVDRQLARYRTMRDFTVTAEPSGGETGHASDGLGSLLFVVQKHAARQLHYDSALTQRTMEQIAESNDHVWDSRPSFHKSEAARPKDLKTSIVYPK